MRVTYLAHSGFLVELPSVTLLFDWWKGELPPLRAEKPLLVFVSHGHEDHFDPHIFPLDNGRRAIRFFLGKGIHLGRGSMARWGVSEATAAKCRLVRGGDDFEAIPGVRVEALRSTDAGVAYLVTADGKTIYHAGDLHWWHWEGEPKADNGTMAANFKAFTEPLRGRRIDLAFVPLDGRLKEAEDWGLRYLLDLAELRTVIPMHQWEDYSPTERFLQKHPEQAGRILPVTQEPQSWEIP